VGPTRDLGAHQYGSVSLHGGIIDITPQICATIDNVAYGTTIKVVS